MDFSVLDGLTASRSVRLNKSTAFQLDIDAGKDYYKTKPTFLKQINFFFKMTKLKMSVSSRKFSHSFLIS